MDKYVYISYSHNDSLFANNLTNELFRAGVNTWFDKTEIEAGDNWQKRMDEGINGASVMLFISSKNSKKSLWTGYEISKFIAKGGKVIPLIIDDFGIDNLPESLRSIHYLDFRDLFLDKFAELLAILLNMGIYRNVNITEPIIKSKGYVFLSYCEEDKDFVSELKYFLKKNKYAYWDYEESNRDYHNQLFLELEDAISNAAATLSILSKFWKQSKWALKEYFFSEEVGTPVFLLKAKELEPTLAIAGIPYIDFTISSTDGFGKLSRELKRKNL